MSLRNEGAFWAKVREAFKDEGAFLRKLPAEGFAGKGTPDGIFAVPGAGHGVVELKYEPAWPARAATTVPVNVTPEQWNWLADYVAHDGRGLVLLGVEDDWFLLRMYELSEALMAFPQAWGLDVASRKQQGIRVPQQWLRERPFYGRLGELARVPALVARISVTA